MRGDKPVWLITYEGADVSDELTPMLLTGEYVDHLQGKADELRLTVEDPDGRWREGWWPAQGDRLTAKMGIEGAPLLDAGEFSVDETELSGPPDIATISALSAPQSGTLRTKQSRAFEGLTLSELAATIASELDLRLLGSVDEVYLGRVTQAAETNLAFLRRLAEEYGYAFSIRPPNLVFFKIAELEAQPPVLTIDRTMLRPGWSLKGSVQQTYVACEVSWLDPATKQLRTTRVEASHARQSVTLGSSEPLPLPARTLRRGMSGDDVRNWQTFLVSLGFDTGGVDGDFGTLTRTATMGFQRTADIDVDGVAGSETYRAAVAAGYSQTERGTRSEVSGKVLRLEVRVETVQQAELKALAALAQANRLRASGKLLLRVGDYRALAGSTIYLPDMGRLSGNYLVQTSRHNVNRGGGYVADIEVTCV